MKSKQIFILILALFLASCTSNSDTLDEKSKKQDENKTQKFKIVSKTKTHDGEISFPNKNFVFNIKKNENKAYDLVSYDTELKEIASNKDMYKLLMTDDRTYEFPYLARDAYDMDSPVFFVNEKFEKIIEEIDGSKLISSSGFINNIAIARTDKKSYLIDDKGNIKLSIDNEKYALFDMFGKHEKFYKIDFKNQSLSFVGTDGQEIEQEEMIIDESEDHKILIEGYSIKNKNLDLNNAEYFIDSSHKGGSKHKSEHPIVRILSKNNILASDEDGNLYILDEKGKTKLKLTEKYKDSSIAVFDNFVYSLSKDDEKTTIYNTSFKKIKELNYHIKIYDNLNKDSDIYKFEKDKKFGYINSKGEILLDAEYDSLSRVIDNIGFGRKSNELYKFILD